MDPAPTESAVIGERVLTRGEGRAVLTPLLERGPGETSCFDRTLYSVQSKCSVYGVLRTQRVLLYTVPVGRDIVRNIECVLSTKIPRGLSCTA